MLEKDILTRYAAEVIHFKKGDFIFREGQIAQYYFQVLNGGVKMNHFSETGNEFIQGIFGKNRSFGEPPLLIGSKYPANAVAVKDSTIYRLKKQTFTDLITEHPDIHFQFSKLICRRLYYKATMANGISSNRAEEALYTFFNYLKHDIYQKKLPFELRIDLTRKNIAGLLGLSVETTIRTIKNLEKKEKLKIIDHQIYF